MTACRSCGKPITWAKTATGKAIPLNVERSERGNIELRNGVAIYVTPDANAVPRRFTSHFSDCPHAAQHRKSKEPTP